MVPSILLLRGELLVFVKENLDRKKKIVRPHPDYENIIY